LGCPGKRTVLHSLCSSPSPLPQTDAFSLRQRITRYLNDQKLLARSEQAVHQALMAEFGSSLAEAFRTECPATYARLVQDVLETHTWNTQATGVVLPFPGR
jgi:hypothetical protein